MQPWRCRCRRTWQDFSTAWGKRTDANPFTARMNATTKYVVSRTLQDAEAWQNSVLLPGDAAATVAELKAQPGGDLGRSVEMNRTIEIPVEAGRHTRQVRHGQDSSSSETFDAAEGEIVAFRCTGKRFLPVFLASFVVPKLALKLVRDGAS